MAVVAAGLLLPAAAGAQDTTFPVYRAAQDQYGPEPTPTPAAPAPAGAAAPSSSSGQEASRPVAKKKKKKHKASKKCKPKHSKRCKAKRRAAARRKAAARRRAAAKRKRAHSGVLAAVESGRNGGGTAGKREQGSALPLAKAQGANLPFTGFDLTTLGLLGVMGLAGGVTLRAATRKRYRSGRDGLSSRARS